MMRVLVWRGAVCLIAFILAGALNLDRSAANPIATARAQSVPKAVEQGGTDAEFLRASAQR